MTGRTLVSSNASVSLRRNAPSSLRSLLCKSFGSEGRRQTGPGRSEQFGDERRGVGDDVDPIGQVRLERNHHSRCADFVCLRRHARTGRSQTSPEFRRNGPSRHQTVFPSSRCAVSRPGFSWRSRRRPVERRRRVEPATTSPPDQTGAGAPTQSRTSRHRGAAEIWCASTFDSATPPASPIVAPTRSRSALGGETCRRWRVRTRQEPCESRLPFGVAARRRP